MPPHGAVSAARTKINTKVIQLSPGRPSRHPAGRPGPNLLHLARMLKGAGGIPAHGNQRSGWDAGCRYDFDNPDYP
jgi:hypothetical protein